MKQGADILADTGSQKQKNVTTYALSPNRQRPLAGTAHAAVFNVFRRTRHQILYWLPPLLIGYATMQWATERYVHFRVAKRRKTLEKSTRTNLGYFLRKLDLVEKRSVLTKGVQE